MVPVNGVGDGQPLTKNQSVLSEPPEVSCDPDVAMNSVTLHITSQGAALDDTYVITYDDVDGRLETKYYAHRPDGKYTGEISWTVIMTGLVMANALISTKAICLGKCERTDTTWLTVVFFCCSGWP